MHNSLLTSLFFSLRPLCLFPSLLLSLSPLLSLSLSSPLSFPLYLPPPPSLEYRICTGMGGPCSPSLSVLRRECPWSDRERVAVRQGLLRQCVTVPGSGLIAQRRYGNLPWLACAAAPHQPAFNHMLNCHLSHAHSALPPSPGFPPSPALSY